MNTPENKPKWKQIILSVASVIAFVVGLLSGCDPATTKAKEFYEWVHQPSKEALQKRIGEVESNLNVTERLLASAESNIQIISAQKTADNKQQKREIDSLQKSIQKQQKRLEELKQQLRAKDVNFEQIQQEADNLRRQVLSLQSMVEGMQRELQKWYQVKSTLAADATKINAGESMQIAEPDFMTATWTLNAVLPDGQVIVTITLSGHDVSSGRVGAVRVIDKLEGTLPCFGLHSFQLGDKMYYLYLDGQNYSQQSVQYCNFLPASRYQKLSEALN